MIAKKAATLDEVSGGRLILGLGAGWNEPEYAAFGYPYDHRVSRFEEAFTIIRRLLQRRRARFPGRVLLGVDDCLIVPPGPRPDGTAADGRLGGQRMLDITMPYAQSWNAWYAWFGNRPENLGPWMQKVDEACARVGRDPADGRAHLRGLRRADRRQGAACRRGERSWTSQPLTGLDRGDGGGDAAVRRGGDQPRAAGAWIRSRSRRSRSSRRCSRARPAVIAARTNARRPSDREERMMAKRHALGIDFGGTKLLAAVVDLESGEVVATAKKRTSAEGQPEGDPRQDSWRGRRRARIGRR